MLTEEQVRRTVQQKIHFQRYRRGNGARIAATAAALNVTECHLRDLLVGRRPISATLAKRLGFERVVMFRPVA